MSYGIKTTLNERRTENLKFLWYLRLQRGFLRGHDALEYGSDLRASLEALIEDLAGYMRLTTHEKFELCDHMSKARREDQRFRVATVERN